MSFQFQPLQDKVFVKRIEESETLRNGLYIPETAKEKPQEAEVIAVGEGKILDSGVIVSSGLKTGDRILFGKYSGTEIEFEKVKYLILRQDEIFGKIVDDVVSDGNKV
jgi:chaperonin GroES